MHSGRMSGLHLSANTVPAGGRHDLVTVDGRSFAISGESGDMAAATHGLVYDDLRYLSRLRMTVTGGRVELLAASTPTPLSAVVVSRVLTSVDNGRADGARRARSVRLPRSWRSAVDGSPAASWRS